MQFAFATATEIVFGAGTSASIAERLGPEARSALVVVGRDRSRAQPLLTTLAERGVRIAVWSQAGEPTIDDATAATAMARDAEVDVVIAVGGGSAIDLGKAVSALLTNPGDPLTYLEIVGRGLPLTSRAARFVAVPTTAGTGAEVTRNAVLASPVHEVKVSMRSPLMLPALALVDPELTLGMPADVTAATGVDALTQLVEPYVSVRANPMTDGFCLEGLRRVARSLRCAATSGSDLAARTDMALASLLGGLSLANAGLGVAHGIAAPVGGRFHAPHGAACAALLPAAMRVNLRAIRSRAPDSTALDRFATVARVLTGDPGATAEAGIDWLDALRADLHISGLSAHGVRQGDVGSLADAASRASSTRGNPVVLDPGELREIIERAL